MNKLIFIFYLCLMTSCAMIPPYHRSQAPVAKEWLGSKGSYSRNFDPYNIGWQDFFKDAHLQKLINLALEHNRDLQLAILNVESSQAAYRVGQSYGIPVVDAQGNGQIQKIQTVKGGKFHRQDLYTLGFGISNYEIDLFGHVRSLKEQSLQKYLGTKEARTSAQIALVSQVGIEYLRVLELNEEITLTQNVLRNQQDYYDLIKKSYDAGATSELDLRSAQTQVEAARVNMIDYSSQRDEAINDLVLLLGIPLPPDIPLSGSLLGEDFLTDLSAGLPSDVLERRPDILAAEHNIKAANANIGAARAAFFPKIILTGAGGYSSLSLNRLFDPIGPGWNFNPQITFPIFDSGYNQANLDIAKTAQRSEVVQYEKAVQNAFHEVSDALILRASLGGQIKAQADLVQAQKRRYQLADIRYHSGSDSYLNVLTAQQDLYLDQQNLIKLRFQSLSNLITLYKVLGGGWKK